MQGAGRLPRLTNVSQGERAEGLPSGSATGSLPVGLQSCIAHLLDYDPEQERQQLLDLLEENLVGGSP